MSEPSSRNPTPGVRATSKRESVKGWLRLAGTGLLLLCGAGLFISIFLAANSAAAERRRRIQCQVNLRQIGTAFQLYAQDYGGRLPDCTANNPNFYGAVWPWDVPINLVADLEQRGAQRRFLYCPSNPGMNDDRHWNFPQYSHGQTRVLGYAFLFPGCRDVPTELWRFDLNGDGTRKPPEVELAADATVSQQWDYTQIKGIWVDRTSHLKRGRPAGGNVLFEDGHASWRRFEQMKHQIVGQAIWDF
jgi:hypothetical protein